MYCFFYGSHGVQFWNMYNHNLDFNKININNEWIDNKKHSKHFFLIIEYNDCLKIVP